MKLFYLLTIGYFVLSTSCKTGTLIETPVVFEKLTLNSNSFKPDSAIPVKFTCDSPRQVFPELHWNANGNDYSSFVLLMDDPDAVPVAGYVWDHWLIYDIPQGTTSLNEGTDRNGPLPSGTKRGLTSFGDTLYGGPCPPPNQTHHYRFRFYGLDVKTLNLPSGSSRAQVLNAIKGHIVDSALLTGTYRR